VLQPTTIEDLREAILSHPRLQPRGGGSKSGLTASRETMPLELSKFSGLLEYDPSEYTFSALAGTKISDVQTMLADHGQFLPFDPPFTGQGSTLGGVLAAGLSGSGRFRFGGIRDFILGITFMDGKGRLIKSGGKVVKNAAGFDLPKLMVGSLGSFGALIELTFKVFPHPEAYRTLIADLPDLNKALELTSQLSVSPLELYCLDIAPGLDRCELAIRIAGPSDLMNDRTQRIEVLLNERFSVLDGDAEIEHWRKVRDFDWVPVESSLVKVPLTPNCVLSLNSQLKKKQASVRYTVGANLAWIAWRGTIEELDKLLLESGLSGLVILGLPGQAKIGIHSRDSFYSRIKKALDPTDRWAEVAG
jgi:glycolate oxidase FAD binding subunit